MEPLRALQHPQSTPTCSYPQPDKCSPCTYIHLPEDSFYIILHLRLGFPSGLFASGFPTKTLNTHLLPIRAKCPTHLILLDLISRTVLGVEYKSLRSSLCSFLHSPVTSSLLGPNILLNTLFSNIFFISLLVSSLSILAFRYAFLFLKCLLASHLTLFRLSAFFWFGFCNHCILAWFLWSKKSKHSSSNHGLWCFNSYRTRLSLV